MLAADGTAFIGWPVCVVEEFQPVKLGFTNPRRRSARVGVSDQNERYHGHQRDRSAAGAWLGWPSNSRAIFSPSSRQALIFIPDAPSSSSTATMRPFGVTSM